MNDRQPDARSALLQEKGACASDFPGTRNSHVVVGVAVLLLAAISFFWFPGHTILQSDTQIYLPMLERLWDPALYSEDPMAVRPHVGFTLYDEAALLLRRLTPFGFEPILMGQQFVYRAAGILGLYLMASSTGVGVWASLLITALASLGATITGPAVLTVEYEPVPRGFALPFMLLSMGTAAHGRFMMAAAFATIAFGFHPPTAVFYLGLLFVFLLWRKQYREIAVLSIAPAVMLLTLAAGAPAVERAPLFARIDPEWEKLQRMRASYNWVSIWIAGWWAHYSLLAIAFCVAFWRVRSKLNTTARITSVVLPLAGVVSVPVSYLLLEVAKWTLIPQFQPARTLLFVTLFSVLLCTIAAVFAAQSKRYVESVLFFLIPMTVPLIPKLTNLLTPLDNPLAAKRLFLALGLAVLACIAIGFGRIRPLTAVAGLLPFLVIPTLGQVRNYPALHHPELDQLAGWARQSTSKGSNFYFPDLGTQLQPGVFRARSHRAVYVDWKAGGQVNFHRQFSELWWRRWQDARAAQTLAEYAELGIDYVVYSKAEAPSGPAPVYSNGRYEVYRVPE